MVPLFWGWHCPSCREFKVYEEKVYGLGFKRSSHHCYGDYLTGLTMFVTSWLMGCVFNGSCAGFGAPGSDGEIFDKPLTLCLVDHAGSNCSGRRALAETGWADERMWYCSATGRFSGLWLKTNWTVVEYVARRLGSRSLVAVHGEPRPNQETPALWTPRVREYWLIHPIDRIWPSIDWSMANTVSPNSTNVRENRR